MTLGLNESRTRQRRQRRWRLVRWLVALALLVGAGAFAYQTGSMLARQRVVELAGQIDRLEATIAELQDEKRRLNSQLEQAKLRAGNWRTRYEEEVPKGTRQELLSLVDERLEAGVQPERMAFILSKAGNARRCEGGPQTKRFLVQTPISTGANASVSFAEGAITVTAEGASATNAQGSPEAWYDPAEPVTVRFARLGGASTEASGKLPLHHSVVVGDDEHRFTVVDGERRGFVNVTWERCAYP